MIEWWGWGWQRQRDDDDDDNFDDNDDNNDARLGQGKGQWGTTMMRLRYVNTINMLILYHLQYFIVHFLVPCPHPLSSSSFWLLCCHRRLCCLLSLTLVLLILIVIIIVPHRPRPLSSSLVLILHPRPTSSFSFDCCVVVVVVVIVFVLHRPHPPLPRYPHPSSSSSFSSSSPSLFIVLVLVPNLAVAVVVVAVFVIVVVASCLHCMDGQGLHGQKGTKNASQAASIVEIVHHAVLARCPVVRLVLLIGGPFLEGAREGGNESPVIKGPPTTRKPRRIPIDDVATMVIFWALILFCVEDVYERASSPKIRGR